MIAAAFGALLIPACIAASLPFFPSPSIDPGGASPAVKEEGAAPIGDMPLYPQQPQAEYLGLEALGTLSPDANIHFVSSSYYFEYLDREEASVTLQSVTVDTAREGDYYRSTVHLTLENKGWTAQELEEEPYRQYYSPWDNQQYSTTFQIPDGVFVTNYYLDVLGTRKYGLLAERNSALWIYDRVVSRALDPGLVYYDGRLMTLRVFPFSDSETRYTGIEFLHKEPVTLTIDGQAISLAPEAAAVSQPVSVGARAVYLSAAYKSKLPAAERKPHYVFVADCSEGSDVEEIARRVRGFCTENNIVRDEATIYATNDKRKEIAMSDQNWDQALISFPRQGGFGLGNVIDAVARKYESTDTYPVIIAVRSEAYNYGVTWPKTNTSISRRVPELDGYFVLTGKYLRQYIFDSRQSFAIEKLPKPMKTVTAEFDGQTYLLRDDGQPEILARSTPASGQSAPQGDWESAVALMADFRTMGSRPESERPALQLELVKKSFASKVLLPVTSYIVLETEEQETRLLNFQKKLLESGNIEQEYSQRQDDSMEEYDDDSAEEEADDEDGTNPGTGGGDANGGDNANPSTGGYCANTTTVIPSLLLCLLAVLCIAGFRLRKRCDR